MNIDLYDMNILRNCILNENFLRKKSQKGSFGELKEWVFLLAKGEIL